MDRLLTLEQAAELLGVRRTQLYTMLTNGELRSIKIGKLRRVPGSEVDKYIATRLAESPAV